jgi:hypothetical protein
VPWPSLIEQKNIRHIESQTNIQIVQIWKSIELIIMEETTKTYDFTKLKKNETSF